MGTPKQPFSSLDETYGVFAERISPGKVATYRQYGLELAMGHREGAFFADAYSDRRWYNCHCNGGVFNLGHRNPRVTAAVRDALVNLDVGNHHFVSGFRAKLAERLCGGAWPGCDGVIFGVSGGEAVDLAIKAARASTGRQTIISATGGYHGHTGLALSTGDAQYRDMFGPQLPAFMQVPFDDIDAIDAALGDDSAAVILEPIPATLGMAIPSHGYLEKVQQLCRDRGARLILDEVQTGLGRSGARWYHLLDGIEPDIVVTGKGLSGGVYPITATLMTREVHSVFDAHPFVHISTFGGAEPGCVAALEVLDIIDEPGFFARVQQQAAVFVDAFEPLSFEVRNRGLMMGFKFQFENAGMVAAHMLLEQGIFCTWANNDTSVMQFLPPLILSDEEMTDIIDRVRKALS